MHTDNLRPILTGILVMILCTSCAAQVAPVLTNTPARVSTLALKLESDTRAKTRQPDQPKPGEIMPASTYTPDTVTFNITLGRPTSTSVTASLYATASRQVAVAYGAQPGNYTRQTPSITLEAGVPYQIEISELEPNSTCYYQVILDGVNAGEHSFHTQRAPGESFTFTIDADPHNRDPRFDGVLYETTLNNVLNDHPDFHIDLGDTFMTEKLKPQSYADVESSFKDMRPYFGVIGADTPLFLVNGNHEGEIGWLRTRGTLRDLPAWSAKLRQLYYPGPVPGDFYSGSASMDEALGVTRDGYYAWGWGDALFVVLDPFWYTIDKPRPGDLNQNWNWTLGKEQYDWLSSTLEGSEAQYKFVFIHHLVGGDQDARGGVEFAGLFEWGGINADGTYGFDEQRPGWNRPIHQVLVDNQVSAVFHGHDHVYVQQELDGIIYQEVPQPSISDYKNTSIASDYGYLEGKVLASSGHLRVSVGPEQARVEYVRAYLPQDEKTGQQNGQVDASYHILPK